MVKGYGGLFVMSWCIPVREKRIWRVRIWPGKGITKRNQIHAGVLRYKGLGRYGLHKMEL